MLHKLIIRDYTTSGGLFISNLPLTYQVFGQKPGTAPVVLVFHALTGNSKVAGDDGWWKNLIGRGKTIDTEKYSILCFDIPGNGYNGYLIKEHAEISITDVAQWFLKGLQILGVNDVFAGIGGSLGGSILWEMAVEHPGLFKNVIPIATDWKATAWVLAQCRIQQQILKNSIRPIEDARMHAMTFYRSPKSLDEKFGRTRKDDNQFNVEAWLVHHGKKLEERFHLLSYKLMNHLLMGINVTNFYSKASRIEGNILLIGINSDGLFLNSEIKETYNVLKNLKSKVAYAEIDSIHGHDAFLIEFEQLDAILRDVFQKELKLKKIKDYECTSVG